VTPAAPTPDELLALLRGVVDPELGSDIVDLGMVRSVDVDDHGHVAVMVALTTIGCPLQHQIDKDVTTRLGTAPGVRDVALTFTEMTSEEKAACMAKARWNATQRAGTTTVPPSTRVIAVASGKGGVGKSTVAVNLAVALARDGAAVGLLDADITGPNIPLMLGLEGQPGKTDDNKISPLTRHGVKAISIQFFVPQGQPIIWRGPLVGGAITQFLRDVDWGELDYLVIDLPPGTSDAQLTLAQAVPISGSVLVTTPQEVSLLDVEKALAMFKRMSVPVIGVVENMTALACPHCGEMIELFGRGGGERFSREHGLEYLGGVPLDVTVRQGGDVGVPAVAQREPGPAAKALTGIARTIAARMSVRAAAGAGQPVLTIS